MKLNKIALLTLAFFILSTLVVGCSLDSTTTKLKVVNQYEGRYISNVSLVGYEFSSLNITYENSQTFNLDNGMPAGYDNINIQVTYRSGTATWYTNKSFNLKNGATTTITLDDTPTIGLK